MYISRSRPSRWCQSNPYIYQEHTNNFVKISMANRNTLIVIIIGSLLALPDLSSSRWVSSRPHGITTFLINSPPTERDETNRKNHPTEIENGGWLCKFVLWRMYCRVMPKVTASTPSTAKTTVAKTAKAIKKTAITKDPYNRYRGILG